MSTISPVIEAYENTQLKSDLPAYRVGDTVAVHYKIVEGDKERIQVFRGTVIRRRRAGLRSTVTVRKVSFNVGVERTFPLHSPRLERLELVSQGVVRRSRLFYLRDLSGKAARIKDVKDR
jgi:large subunit ribosomal protein L19